MLLPKRQTFFFLDYLVLGLILGTNIFFWKPPEHLFLGGYLGMAFVVYIFSMFLASGFFIHIEQGRSHLRDNILALIKGIGGANVGILALVFFFFQPYRAILFYHTLFTGAAVLAVICLMRTLEWKYFWPRGPLRVLILGEDPYQHLYLRDILSHWRGRETEILIALSGESSADRPRRRSTTVGGNTIRYISGTAARDLLTVSPPFTAIVLGREPLNKELLELLPYCYQNGYSVIGISHFYELVCRKVPLFQVGESWLVHTTFQRPTPAQVFVKRAFDIVFSAILLICLFPVGLLIALAIKLESPGPVLFVQERSGLNGKIFKMLKFRSMRPHADDSHKWPHWEPDLVTRVGHFLRQTGLDELPQLLNILRGDMSFVGPRPARPLVTQHHIDKIPFYAVWLALRPGVTGWAQLRQGQDSGDHTILEKVRYNLYYAKNLSWLFDLEIFFKTVRVALQRAKPPPTSEVRMASLTATPENLKGDQ